MTTHVYMNMVFLIAANFFDSMYNRNSTNLNDLLSFSFSETYDADLPSSTGTYPLMGNGLSLAVAIFSPLSYVGFLYIFDRNGTDRNDPISVKRRTVAAIVNNICSLPLTFYALNASNHSDPFRLMGFKSEGLVAAVSISALLTTVIYLGNLTIMYFDGHLGSIFSFSEWKRSLAQPTWRRDMIIAPITEEIAFRSCSASLMATCLTMKQTILIAPLAFSLSHLHHIGDDYRKGATVGQALLRRVVQGLYTYAFGAYATFIFLRTGHISAPIVTHAICNGMGLPMLHEIGNYTKRGQRTALWIAFLSGFVMFSLSVASLTEPRLYQGW